MGKVYTRSIFKRGKTGLNSQFSFCYNGGLSKSVLLFTNNWENRDGFVPFSKALAQSEM